MKCILVPTDFSEYSGWAMDFAYEIARKAGVQVIALHVIEEPSAQSLGTTGEVILGNQEQLYIAQLKRVVEKRMDNLVNDEKYSGVEMVPQIHFGDTRETISAHIVKHEASLVVMGTLGSSGLEEILIGSNTEKVVRHAKCPVISVPGPTTLESINRIVFATNLDTTCSVTDSLQEIQELADAKLTLLWVNTVHAIDNEESMKENLEKMAQDHNLSNYDIQVTKDITAESGIMNYAEEHGINLIAMATHGRQGLAHIFSGSLAEDIVNNAQRPVWTMKLN